jgi:hypothetical protein
MIYLWVIIYLLGLENTCYINLARWDNEWISENYNEENIIYIIFLIS